MFEPPCRVIATVLSCAVGKYQLLEYIQKLYLLIEVVLLHVTIIEFILI